jgi:hypothetical protein
MKELNFIQVCPDDDYYIWQVHLWLESLKERGLSDRAISLIFTPNYRERSTKWEYLKDLYPEAQFHFYKDEHKMSKLLGVYIPILRPYTLMRFFKDYPEMENKAIFYCDCDILFTEKFDLTPFIEDEVCYISDTKSYISASYFDSKLKDVHPDRLEEYKKRDILNETCELVGISREIAEKWNEHSGGAQYLLKNINWEFWDKVITDCIKIRIHLQNVNKEFFESENKGFQSWCADMWAVLWNLWLQNKETKVVKELDFAWSSDGIKRLDSVGILHNAGIVSSTQGDIPVFYKGTYHQGKNPFKDPHLEIVLNDEKSKTLCSYYYAKKLFEIKDKFKI